MSDHSVSQYLLIASDLAARIARGEFDEEERISGRSVLSAEYNVSPETIRRALAQLSDMKVVTVHHNSGVRILSRDNARRYVEGADRLREQRERRERFQQLLTRQQETSAELLSLADEMAKAHSTLSFVKNCFPTYETAVPAGSPLAGSTIGTLRVWQHTGATIVAIRRRQNVLLSPGPHAELYDGDALLYVGEPGVRERVEAFVRNGPAPGWEAPAKGGTAP